MGREERRKGELSPFEGWIFRVGKEIIGKSLPYRHVRMTNNWNGSRRGSTSVPAAPLEIRFNEDLRVFFSFSLFWRELFHSYRKKSIFRVR